MRASHRAPPEDYSPAARGLMGVGRFDEAAEVLNRLKDERERNSVADELLACRLAWQSGREPDRGVDLTLLAQILCPFASMRAALGIKRILASAGL